MAVPALTVHVTRKPLLHVGTAPRPVTRHEDMADLRAVRFHGLDPLTERGRVAAAPDRKATEAGLYGG